MGKIRTGTSGFNYRHWRGDFYPDSLPLKKWLAFYSEHFKTVEINATFYGSFREATYKKWADTVPREFCFAIKGPRFITHIKRLVEPKESIDYFFAAAKGLGKKLGVVLWQFPPSFKKDEETLSRLNEFLNLLPKETPKVFEFRHKSWFDSETDKILEENKSGIVISESSRFPSEEAVAGGICYIRFHGPGRLYSSPYSTEQLAEWAKKIKKWSRQAEVYCYFNNDSGGHAFRNADELDRILNLEEPKALQLPDKKHRAFHSA